MSIIYFYITYSTKLCHVYNLRQTYSRVAYTYLNKFIPQKTIVMVFEGQKNYFINLCSVNLSNINSHTNF